METKKYLGDGVYVDHDKSDRSLILTTENGIEATNTIFLEPAVWKKLVQYIKDNYPDAKI